MAPKVQQEFLLLHRLQKEPTEGAYGRSLIIESRVIRIEWVGAAGREG